MFKVTSLTSTGSTSTIDIEIHIHVWNPKFHHCGHKNLSVKSSLKPVNSVKEVSSYICQLNFSVIFPSTYMFKLFQSKCCMLF